MKTSETNSRTLLDVVQEQATIRNQRRKFQAHRHYLRFVVFRRDKFTCQFCGRTARSGAELTIDHVIPSSKGGDDSWGNLVTACHECNQGKSDVLLARSEIEGFKDLALLVDWRLLVLHNFVAGQENLTYALSLVVALKINLVGLASGQDWL